MRLQLLDSLRQRYGFRCGYCGVRETDAGARLTVDHFQPRSLGGTDEEDNLVYCCHACNEFKGDYWQPEADERILHPLRDTLANHIRLEADFLLSGLTATGTFHISRLRLNCEALILHRQRRQRSLLARQQQEALLAILRRLDTEIQTLIEQVSTWDLDDL